MRRIFLLEKIIEPGGEPHFRVALWASVPVGREQAFLRGPLPTRDAFLDCSMTSRVSAAELTQPEKDAFTAGQMVECVIDVNWESGRGMVAVQNDLIAKLTRWQAIVNNWNPWVRYGTAYDDAGAGTWASKGQT